MTDLALLILRIAAGGMMAFAHGLPKFLKLLEGSEIKFPDPINLGPVLSFILAAFAELFSSLMLILGIYPRINLLLLSFTMFVAAFIQHASDPFKQKELALLYLVIFIVLFLTGAGKYSISGGESSRGKKRNKFLNYILH